MFSLMARVRVAYQFALAGRFRAKYGQSPRYRPLEFELIAPFMACRFVPSAIFFSAARARFRQYLTSRRALAVRRSASSRSSHAMHTSLLL
jgi:hypothetical protein